MGTSGHPCPARVLGAHVTPETDQPTETNLIPTNPDAMALATPLNPPPPPVNAMPAGIGRVAGS